ncbi:MAG: solute carrier family 23 protein, partial [Actinomycetota bacterium]
DVPLGEIPGALSWALFALAALLVLQALRPPVGIGHLMPPLNSALYLQPSVAAVELGGRSLLAGMTVLAGAFEIGFSRVVSVMRRLFPPLVTGLIVFLVGAEVGVESVRLGVDAVRESAASDVVEASISAVTFLTIVGGVVWGTLWVRNMAPIIGIVIGTALSLVFIDVPASDRRFIDSTDLVGLPDAPLVGFDLEWSLVVPFLVLGLAAGLRTVGVVMTLDHAASPGQRSTDHAKVERGVRNDGVGAVLAGAVGIPGISSAPSAVGVQMAAGVMSRWVALPLAGMLVAIAFFPRALAHLVTAPAAVVSALLMYYASFMMIGGVKLIVRQHLDTRATFVLGASIGLALGARTYGLADGSSQGTDWVALITGSMVTVGVLSAMGLSLLFRVGQSRHESFSLQVAGEESPRQVSMAVSEAIDELEVGIDADAASRYAGLLASEVVRRGLADGPVEADLSTDDLELRIELRYDGRPLDVQPMRPLEGEDLTDENVFAAGLSRFLDAPRPDDVTVRTRGSTVRLELVYDLV